MKYYLSIGIVFVSLLTFGQGSFAPAAGEPGTTAMHKDSSAFVAWASNVIVTRGYQDIADPSLGFASFGVDADATGQPDPSVVSLGDSGVAIVTFDGVIHNGSGPDFAVFENSFSNLFLELGFVEVSSDGVNFERIPATSEVQDTTQVDGFGTIDPTEIHNFAGKYRATYGTPFDLDDVPSNPLVDVNHITHIKIVDCVGRIQGSYTTHDHEGNVVNDPYPTPFPSSGFDLDAVGAIHFTSTVSVEELETAFKLYPNPLKDVLRIEGEQEIQWRIFTIEGRQVEQGDTHTINTELWKSGSYIIVISCGNYQHREVLVKP